MNSFKQYLKEQPENQSEQQVKEFISKRLNDLNDQAFATVLRKIIFTNSQVNWNNVIIDIFKWMPEIKNL